MTTSAWTRLLTAAFVAAAAAPVAASAQATLDSVYVRATSARADELDQKAQALYAAPKKWRQAAYLHQLAAGMRADDDPRMVHSLSMAANLLYYVGDVGAARGTMERAARAAEAQGDVMKAAAAYVDAGYLAIAQHGDDRAMVLARKAQTLASSPLLNAEQRTTITRRLGYAQLVAMLPDK
ncbi:MAG: hypothetical protein WKG32_07265 [Gemmatimonadaceae bacterium]